MIPRSLCAVGAAGVALTCTLPASAEIHTIATAGLWSAYGGTGDDNRALCGIGTEGADTRRIIVQQNAGDNGLELRLKKDSWSIPGNTPVQFQVQFDSYPPIQMQATGTDQTITVAMPFDQTIPFMRGVRAGRQIRITFQNGNEAPWTGGLSGSARAINAFNTCRGNLGLPTTPQPSAAPQPPAATQPFAPAPAGGPPPDATLAPSGGPLSVQGRP